MAPVTAAVSALLAALLAFTAVRKLSHDERVVESYARVGVPEDRLNHLAAILLAGAAGLVAGLVWTPLGIAAAAGVLCYFLAALAFHVRANAIGNMLTPLVYAAMAAVALALHIAAP